MKSSAASTSLSSPSQQQQSSFLTLDDELSHLDPDQILDRLTHAKTQVAHFNGLIQQYLDALDQLVQDNQIDTDIHYNDWHFYRQKGKASYIYPDFIKQQEADLKQSKELAIACGDATVKYGKPFWTIRHDA